MLKQLLVLLFLIPICLPLNAQKKQVKIDKIEPVITDMELLDPAGISLVQKDSVLNYPEADVAPQYAAGSDSLQKFIDKHLRPVQSKDTITKRVVTRITVGSDGIARNPTFVRSWDKPYDNEAMRITELLVKHRWISGEKAGEKVPVYYNIFFYFKKE